MHIIRVLPDPDHPISEKLVNLKKAWYKHQNYWPCITQKRTFHKEQILANYTKLKLDAISDFRIAFPVYKDSEIKVCNMHAMLPAQNSTVYRFGFEIRLPYKEE